jgi:purine-binding chemotaxis protein CheW
MTPETTPAASASTAVDSGDLQVVMISLGGETFALEAELVREIIDPVPVTRVAGARADVANLINVRGNIIPLADLRLRFGMPMREHTAETRFVVIEVELGGDPIQLGIIADKVHEVTEISRTAAQPTPRVGMHWRPEFISFITKWRDEFVIVPNLERVLN